MDWNDFFKSLKGGQLLNVYYFTGPEELTKREALSALRAAILPPGLEQLNDATLEGVSAQDIIDSAETLPVMCERRIVAVRDWAPLLPGKSKNEEAEVSRMLEWLKDAPETSIVIFYMSVEPDGRKKLSGALKKLPGHVEFGRLGGAALQRWCTQQLMPMGKRISSDAVNELTLMAGQDLTRLSGELKKLAAYVEDAPEIGVKDVQAIVSPSPEYSVFMILDHLLAGRLAEATRVVNTVLRTEPSIVRIISLLSNQLRIDVHIKYALDARASMPEVHKALGITDARASHVHRQVRSIPAEALKERYLACVEADYAIKSGKLKDRAALDALMLKILRK